MSRLGRMHFISIRFPSISATQKKQQKNNGNKRILFSTVEQPIFHSLKL